MRVNALLSAAYRPRTHGSSRTSILWNLGSVNGTPYSIGYWCRASFRKPVPWWQWRCSHAELQSLPFLPARLAEIVEQGCLVTEEHAMAEAIGTIASISREAWQASARARFGSERIIGKYFERYQLLAENGSGSLRPKEWNGCLH